MIVMPNRLLRYFEEHGVPDYYLVRGACGVILVSPEVARYVMRLLNRWLRPRWIRLVDLCGSEIWVRSKTIYAIVENTRAQRAADRKLCRLFDAEEDDGNHGY